MAIVAGVRRQTVSVLFVDIVGFTALVDGWDCADVRALQMDYFALVSAVVRDHGGVVEKYVGDAVMAVFGLSSRRPEGGAAAAVRAGMGVQEAISGVRLAGRHEVHTRAGVSTGDVMVDLAAARDGGYGMVCGGAVSLAAKLQACAPHDTLVVCPATHRLSSSSVDYQELPPAEVGGRPVDIFRALVTRTSVSAHVA
ncbi:adenylate/guanylate cyclase domain-containing protein [Actinoplanes sp. NPDC051633]|uniref:adenylate/guanylate cyclase domain-containing protein n=1 Tax=Actinoplanes sp. NPDC051633 TaxID=3155670 RepID=UPI003418CB95